MKSRLYLRKLEAPPATILEHLFSHFPQIPRQTWTDRVAQGLVVMEDGTPVLANSPYRHGVTIVYQREVPLEPQPLETEVIIYRDREILVVDKPHGIPVTPAGSYVERSLLARLQRSTGLSDLTPMHRLDRETAGVVLLAINPAARGQYQQLFAERTIEREYFAVAHVVNVPEERIWNVENRIEAGEPWYRQRTGKGPVNAVTLIELLELQEGIGFFRLLPRSGRTHQLRVHMASIGFPIVGDPLYPEVRSKQDGDLPLQLLAHSLAFTDPLNGSARHFTSARRLQWTPSPDAFRPARGYPYVRRDSQSP